ncbi:MAG: phage head completion protein [Parasphingorhabdus sp.]
MVNFRINAGDLVHRVMFKRIRYKESSSGSMVPDGFTDICAARAMVNYGRADERRRAGIDSSEAAATIRVRTSAAVRNITAADVIGFDGAEWNITGIVPFGQIGMDFTAIRRR